MAIIRKKTSVKGVPRKTISEPSRKANTSTTTLIWRAKRSIRMSSGGLAPSVVVMEPAIRPTSVRSPVATTSPRPRPVSTVAPA